MKTLFTRFLKDESGTTAIEYAIIAGLISVALIAGAQVAGPEIETIMDDVGSALTAANAE